MHKLISIGLSPNVQYRDVKLALQTIIQPWIWYQKIATNKLSEKLSDLLEIPKQNIFLTISGRSAIFQALKVIGIKEGDEVIIQAFTCVAVVNPILWLNAKPVYVDIIKETLNMDICDLNNKITPKTKAIILQHTFGLPFTEIEQVKAMIKSRDISIIEDCAHSLGAKIENQNVGTICDFGILSFGRDKMVSSVFGGALIVNNPKYQNLIQTNLVELPKASRKWIIKQLLHPVLTYLIIKSYHLGIGKILQKLLSKSGVLSKATSRQEKGCGVIPNWIEWQYPDALARLALLQLKTFNEDLNRRNMIAEKYSSNKIISSQSDNSSRVWLRYPILVDDPNRFFDEFKKLNIYLGDWYNQVVAPKEVNLIKACYELGMTPNAKKITMQIINLPVYPKLTNLEIDVIIQVWNSLMLKNPINYGS